jgi:hypothetical protein
MEKPMNLLKRLFGGTSKQEAAQDSDALIYYVKGHKCGAITRVRIDRRNDLSRDDDDNFFVRKVVVDSKCYGQVELELRFDPHYNEISREIKGGVFVTREEWEAQMAQTRQP